jgi:putative redox protein
VKIGGRELPISRDFREDLETHSVLEAVANWDKSFLVIHGTRDELVPLALAETLFAAAKRPKSFFTVPGADHLLLEQRDLVRRIALLLDSWLQLREDRPLRELT